MDIVIAPDSFKGSLTAVEASNIMDDAIREVKPGYTTHVKPMADGGEGTLESILQAKTGELVSVMAEDALGHRRQTEYGIIDNNTAVIECAKIVGLPQVPENKRNPDITTTYGIGEVIIDALDKGCISFIIGLGGSATNDAGVGMLTALGMSAFDENDRRLGGFGVDVPHVRRVDMSNMDMRLAGTEILVASDVDNPLCGEKGATVVFGPQKGATSEQLVRYDEALHRVGMLIEKQMNRSMQTLPGAGAAGGLGFAFLALEGMIKSGAELVGEAIDVEKTIEQADLVITGEGKSDEQTLYGKAPSYIANVANTNNVPSILISGSVEGDLDLLRETFSGCFSIINEPVSLEESIQKADAYLYEQTKQLISLVDSLVAV